MNVNPLHHAILGVGGVGGLIGASLAHSGAGVTLVVRREALASYPRRLRLESPFGNFDVDVSVAAEVPPVDVLWLATKATQLESSLHAITDPASVRAIVPLLNGVDHIPLLRSKYGAGKVIAATIGVESERIAPGHVIHRSPFVLLNVSSAGRALLSGTLDQLQRLGFQCRFMDDEPIMMWNKLAFIAAFALTTTASGKGTGDVLADAQWRAKAFSVIREACAVAAAEGARSDADTIIAGAAKMPGNMRSSMQKDVEQGKTPELDAIAGPIIRGGQEHGIDVPVTRSLAATVQQKASASQP